MSPTPINTIRVTSQTTLDDLKAFQDSIGKDDAKLRGSKNRDGSITLKAVDRDSSFLSKMFGVSKKRRDAARSALTMVMTNSGAVDRKPTGSLQSLINADRKHSPKSAMLRDVVAFAKADNTQQPQKVSETAIKSNSVASDVRLRKFPTLEAKGLDTTRVENMLRLASDFSRDQPLTDAKVKEFSTGISKEILDLLPDLRIMSSNERTMLGISDIEGYVQAAVTKAVPLPHNEHVAAAMNMIAKGVADELSEKLLGTKHLDDQSFQIGGDTYTRVATLGKGGHGTAMLYRCEAKNQEVVLKVPPEIHVEHGEVTVASTQFDFKSEVDMHTKIMDSASDKHPSVLSFEGAVRLPNGQIATLTEACKGGEMAQVLKKLDQAVKDGTLTKEQAMTCKLTLMRDMVDGQNVLFQRGFSHRDVKFENVFVDAQGNGKVADFGDTAFSHIFSLSEQKLVDNPVFLAPENIVARNKLNSFEDSVREHQYAHKKAKVEIFNALVGPGGAFAHLGQTPLDAAILGPIREDADRFAANDRAIFGADLLDEFQTRIANLGEIGQLLETVINDLADGELGQMQSAIDTGKARLPVSTLVNGQAADVWSFGAAMIESFTKPGDTIALTRNANTDAAEKGLVKYFTAKPAIPSYGGLPTPPPEALEVGGFLTDSFVSPHENGTVTGDKELDALINATLERNPADRPSLSDIRQNPVFSRKGVGDPSTRAVISALVGKPAKSADDIQALATQMRT